jgi:hypothetical protein
MLRLSFPREYPFEIRSLDGRPSIYDPIRRRFVPLTPEEWVRQNLVQHLIQDLGCPAGLTAVERYLEFHGKPFRADVVVHDRTGAAVLLAECKEPGVRIGPETFDQLTAYNRVLRARYLLVTNGLDHYCCALDLERQTHRLLDRLPRYEDL